ncbi:hypothetical protein scyTo_0026106, partial [Scyliorhinus torazame]|nr:hypothetical protein [Scyliorhinus torazame]
FEGTVIRSEKMFNNPEMMQLNVAAEAEEGELKGPE